MVWKLDSDGYFSFALLNETTHGFFSRHRGVSLAPFDSLNISDEVGDYHPHVQANCAYIRQTLGLSYLLQCKQLHGTDFYIIENPEASIPPCDALITNLRGVGLMIKHADCQAALFYDPVNKVVAAVHAGWRGAIGKIYTKIVQVLKDKFKSRPENLLVGISPSLGKEHAEFINYRNELPESFWKYQIRPNYFDFWTLSFDELIEAGLLPHHIQMAQRCTYANKEYFSYRREKTTGRMGSVIALI